MRVLISATYFFCLLCSYYVLRPVRDEMGVRSGVENLPWLFTGTFIAMLLTAPLFGWVSSRLAPRKVVPAVYLFFMANLLLFWLAFQRSTSEMVLGAAFFIWLSVYNLCVVSVFWSFMADVFGSKDAKQRFGPIAAGGSAGAITGPALTAFLAPRIGPIHLMLISAALLGLALLCVGWLVKNAQPTPEHDSVRDAPPMRGSVLEGIRLTFRSPLLLGVSAIVICYTTFSTFFYFEQTALVGKLIADSGQRTAWFARVDLITNTLSILLQMFGTAALITRLGVGPSLAAVPLVVGAGLAALAASPSLALLALVQILHRAGNFAVTRPGREMLFTHVDRPTKYKGKNFVDTSVFRASDALSAWVMAGIRSLGWSGAIVALCAVPIAAVWSAVAYFVGRRHDVETAEPRPAAPDPA